VQTGAEGAVRAADPLIGSFRVLQVHTPHREPGGEDVAVEEDRRLLASNGHVIEQCLVENPHQAFAAAGALLRAPWNPAAARAVVARAQAFEADVVHVHNTWFALSPAVISALAAEGFRVVVTLHNFRAACANGLLQRNGQPCDLCVGSHSAHAVLHRCYRGSALLSIPAALTVTVARRRNVWQRDVSRFLALEESAIPTLIASGVPGDRVTLRNNFVASVGRRDLPPSASHTVVYVGRLSPEKGPQVLLKAWRRSAPPGLRLQIFGDGPLRGALEEMRVPGVSFMGRVAREQVMSALQSARALVFPSTCREAGPLAPLEAAAAGTPVVISDLVGMASQLASAGAGWSCAAGDVGGLAHALTRLRDPAAVDRAGEAVLQLHADRYSPQAALASLEAVYQQVHYKEMTPG
jgi:glycosyltransferase involved in cell wall biosynthesis